MIGVDTNVLLRWLVDESLWPIDDPDQVEAAAKLLSDPTNRFFVDHVVLAETIWVLSNPLQQPKRVLLDILDRLFKATNIEIQARDAVAAAVSGFASGPGGFSDRLIGAINRHSGCHTTLTFDKAAGRTSNFTRLGASSRIGG